MALHAQPLESLDPLQWENRILLIHADADATASISEQLQQEKAGLNERHIAWFLINHESVQTNHDRTLSPALRGDLLDSLFESPDITVVLIGKDGGVKGTYQNLDLEAVFTRIDGMPMRRAEMRRQQRE